VAASTTVNLLFLIGLMKRGVIAEDDYDDE
jgi:hypothetical protein